MQAFTQKTIQDPAYPNHSRKDFLGLVPYLRNYPSYSPKLMVAPTREAELFSMYSKSICSAWHSQKHITPIIVVSIFFWLSQYNTYKNFYIIPITVTTSLLDSAVCWPRPCEAAVIVRCVLSALTSRGGGGRGSLEFKQMLFGFRVWGLGFRVQDLGFRVQVLGFRVQVLGFRVQDLGFRVQGLGLKVGSGK